jgi:hypothetical protein
MYEYDFVEKMIMKEAAGEASVNGVYGLRQ